MARASFVLLWCQVAPQKKKRKETFMFWKRIGDLKYLKDDNWHFPDACRKQVMHSQIRILSESLYESNQYCKVMFQKQSDSIKLQGIENNWKFSFVWVTRLPLAVWSLNAKY